MQDVGLKLAKQPPDVEDCREIAAGRQAPPAPAERVRHEAFLFDGFFAVLKPRRDMYFVACGFCRVRHGQAVREEVPVLSDQKEQAPWHGAGF